jgi:hypothetical protein
MPTFLSGAFAKGARGRGSSSKKINVQVAPPDEETLKKLNAMVKEYPFCIYYKQKNNDPL